MPMTRGAQNLPGMIAAMDGPPPAGQAPAELRGAYALLSSFTAKEDVPDQGRSTISPHPRRTVRVTSQFAHRLAGKRTPDGPVGARASRSSPDTSARSRT